MTKYWSSALNIIISVVIATTLAGCNKGALSTTPDPTPPAPVPSVNITGGTGQFGNVVVGQTSTQTIKVTNVGQVAIVVSTISISGTGFAMSGVVNGQTIAIGSSADITLTFTPTTVGPATGSLSVTTNASSTANVSQLTGTGISNSASLSVPASVAFGNVTVNQTGTQNVTLTNTGNTIVNVTNATVAGSGFSVNLPSGGITIPAGQSSTLSVIFTPTATGNASGTLTITANAAVTPTTSSLSGTGFQITVAPSTAAMAIVWGKQFTGTVAGSTDTRTTWSVNGIAGGNATVGTITASGFYTAPTVVPSGAITITATSVADITKTATSTATVSQTLLPPQLANLITCHDDGTPNGTCQVIASPADPLPALLNTYTDPVFQTKIKRVSTPSQALTLPNGSTLPFLVPNYAPNQAWNADGTKLILFATDGHWNLLDGTTYVFIRQLDNTAFLYDGQDNNLRWDNHDPDKIWYTFKNQVMTYSVASNSSTIWDTLKVLPGTLLDASAPNMFVKMSDYCNYSDDNTRASYRLVDGNGLVYAFFSYDIANKQIKAAKDLVADLHIPGAPLNKTPASTCVSPSGNFVYSEWNTNKLLVSAHWGTEVYDFATLTPVSYATAGRITTTDVLTHSDVGLDANGDDVYVNQADQSNGPDFVTFTSIRLKDGVKTKNKLPDNFYGNKTAGIVNNWHISMRGVGLPGWALVSTFTEARNISGDPDLPGATVPMQAEIFALKLDGSGEVRRIAHNQTTRFDYFAEAHASVNREFSKVIFGSSWRLNTVPLGCATVTCFPVPPDSVHAFVAQLP
jgi:hypothetical protein